MDGFLPPVDNASWLDYQRKRAERFARERIAAAGATAGDWIGRATQTVDQLVPDWSPLGQSPPPPAPAPPPPPPPVPVPSPLSGVGNWAQGALARIGQIGSDVGAGVSGAASQAVDQAQGIVSQVQEGFVGAGAVPRPSNVFTPGRYQPQTPWQAAGGIANQLERGATEPVEDIIGRVQESSSGASGGLQRVGVPSGVADVLGFGAGVLDVPGAIGGASFQEQLRGAGATPEQARFGGDIAEIVTPNPIGLPSELNRARQIAMGVGTVGGAALGYATAPEDQRLQGTVKGAVVGGTIAPDALDLATGGVRLVQSGPDLARGVARRFRAPADEALGIRSGQRFRMPRLTPEQEVQRAKDGAAEQRVFDAIQQLWRRGSAGKEAADDLRFLAVGKGEAGEQAAREYLAAKGLEDVLPLAGHAVPTGDAAGITPAGGASPGGDWRALLNSALATIEPYGAARTSGEHAFDLATGTAGGVVSAATAPDDATWQERAKRFAAGSAWAAMAGPTLRSGRGLVTRGLASAGDDVLGITARTAQEHLDNAIDAGAPADELARLATAVRKARVLEREARRAARAGLGTAAPPSAPALPRGRITLADIPELMGAIPLASPTSLAANLTSGLARTLERVTGVAFEGRPIDALADVGAMARELPGATRRIAGEIRRGPTRFNPGMTGAPAAGDLTTRGGLLPGLATGGVRINSATDQFWRDLNEAGARAQATRRGLGPTETARLTQRAGDFATWGGPNSAVAKKLTELKGAIRDPEAGLLDKSIGAAVTSMAPYVMMPERLLRASVGSLIPVEAGYGMVKALQRGDRVAAREFRGRALAGMAATTALTYAYYHGGLTGDAPQDATERRRREAQGEQWNTIALPGGGRLQTRYLGSLGMQANAIATTLDAARKAQAQGGDPGAVLENGFNAAVRWGLNASYLSDLTDFADAVKGPQGAAGAIRQLAAGQPSRFTGPITGIINAADPYERQAETFPEMVASRTGLRGAVPPRIDPVTGEPQRRRGSGLSRYLGERGDVTTPEGDELARLALQPRVLGRTEAFEGAKQTPAQRQAAQRALGSETGKAVREAMAAPGYASLPDEEKKSRLQGALRTAADRADVVLGEGVARGTKQQAQREWDAVPKYVGVKGTPDEIRRQNADISRAQSLESEYRKKYGEGGWRAKLREEEPDAFALVNKTRRDADVLTRQRKAIEKKYGVTLG